MPKVIYIISDINKAVFFEHTALLLREAGIDISFILINSRESHLAAFLQANGFKTHFIKVGKLLHSRRQIQACAKILRAEQPEVVHCHLAAANFVGLTAAWLARIPIRIYTRHAGKRLEYSRKESLLDSLQNRLATRIVAITQNTKELLLSEGVPERKITIVHHGFDIDRMLHPDLHEVLRIRQEYNPATSPPALCEGEGANSTPLLRRGAGAEVAYPVVGVIARWMKWKGIQYIIPAFARLLKEYPGAKLCLFNASDNCDYSREIREMLHALPERNYQIVAFENNIYDLYHLFDIYVHVPVNPWCEAFGQTYVEALAAGVPSIFTLSGIAREFVTEDNAFIVDFENSDQIYDRMIDILEGEGQRIPGRRYGNGREIVSRMFSLDKYISTLLAMYK